MLVPCGSAKVTLVSTSCSPSLEFLLRVSRKLILKSGSIFFLYFKIVLVKLSGEQGRNINLQ